MNSDLIATDKNPANRNRKGGCSPGQHLHACAASSIKLGDQSGLRKVTLSKNMRFLAMLLTLQRFLQFICPPAPWAFHKKPEIFTL